jgi:hypothetical protein
MSQRVAIIAISLTCVRGVSDLVVEMLSPLSLPASIKPIRTTASR